MWMQLDEAQQKALERVLEDATMFATMQRGESKDADVIAERLAWYRAPDANDQRFRNAVNTNNELEMDDDAVTSVGGDGAFVMTWTFVSNEAAGVTDDEDWSCDNCGETAQDGSGTCITCGQVDDEE